MKNIIEESLKKAKSYKEYKELILDLLKQKKSTGTDQNENLFNYSKLNQSRMKRLDKQVEISSEAENKAKKIEKDFTWLILTESWCGDAAQTLPIINKFAEKNSKIDLKIVSRDENEDLMNQFLTNGSRSIPKLIVVDKSSNEVVNSWGPRSQEATNLIENYKSKYGKIDAKLKEDLQLWYNKDKGKQIEKEMISLLENMI